MRIDVGIDLGLITKAMQRTGNTLHPPSHPRALTAPAQLYEQGEVRDLRGAPGGSTPEPFQEIIMAGPNRPNRRWATEEHRSGW